MLASQSIPWLHRPVAYTICAPLATAAGAATTIAAPILLDPASFASFALLVSFFQYVADFDLGLSRLVDRTFARANGPDAMRQFMVARLCVAASVVVAVLVAAQFTGALTAVTGVAGVAFMLSCGPLDFYRASSNIYAFTLTALLIQAGQSLPRLAGLLAGGVSGCMLALAAWYVMTAVVLNAPFVGILRERDRPVQLLHLFTASLPLFVFSSLWLVYLLASRWFSWLLSSSATDAGLFAFGASLVSVGVGLIGVVAQAYYPRHLTQMDKTALCRELTRLLVLVTGGSLVGDLFCRFGLGLLFPHFLGAAPCTAVLLVSGIPLCLCAWLIPLVIARSGSPWREALFMFGIGLVSLYALMCALGAYAGLQGQAWACTPPAIALLGMQLHLVIRGNLLDGKDAIRLWCGVVAAGLLCGAVWYVLFHALL